MPRIMVSETSPFSAYHCICFIPFWMFSTSPKHWSLAKGSTTNICREWLRKQLGNSGMTWGHGRGTCVKEYSSNALHLYLWSTGLESQPGLQLLWLQFSGASPGLFRQCWDKALIRPWLLNCCKCSGSFRMICCVKQIILNVIYHPQTPVEIMLCVSVSTITTTEFGREARYIIRFETNSWSEFSPLR